MKAFNRTLWIGFICLIALVVLSACGPVSNQDVTLNLKEASVNEIIHNATATQDGPFRISGIDMKDGYITVYMTYSKDDGSQLTGSYDVALKMDKGKPVATINNVNMPGLELDPNTLDQISQLIAKDFLLAATRINGQVAIKTLNINEDSIQLAVNIK